MRQDHPRSRGEYDRYAQYIQLAAGSSPLSRGIRLSVAAASRSGGIIPALAGNTREGVRRRLRRGDHPRSRGEYWGDNEPDSALVGSSPLSRGIRVPGRLHGDHGRIIPALAGNTVVGMTGVVPAPDHPRSRGEYVPVGQLHVAPYGSSPLSRGILVRCKIIQIRIRIIPALAGNTRRSSPCTASRRDHPRSRGEYGGSHSFCPGMRGSSPLSRGIQYRIRIQTGIERIIPALAGNT